MEQIAFTLKSEKEILYNDVIFDRLFEVSNSVYTFLIKPKTTYWRFGIRLSDTENIQFYNPSGRYKTDLPLNTLEDLHLAAGDHAMNKNWRNPNKLQLAKYYFQDGPALDQYDNYIENSVIEWDINFTDKDYLISRHKCGDYNYETKIEVEDNLRYFKVFAWADEIPFEINCDLTISDISDRINNTNNTFWLLKLSPESWNTENLRVGMSVPFSLNKSRRFNESTAPQQRPEYGLYFKAKKGDKMLGYAYGKHNEIVCVFEVTNPVFRGASQNENLGLKIINLIEPRIPLASFLDKINFQDKLNKDSDIRLFEISEKTYEEILSSNKEEYIDNVDLLTDGVSRVDLLSRAPFVNALADYIARLWKTINNEAYTIHISGEWGSGKSNILNFLEKRLEEKNESKDSEWLIVNYNAWENQHIAPPWWIFMDNVYKGILRKKTGWNHLIIWLKELWWRIFSVNKMYWIAFLLWGSFVFYFFYHFNLSDLYKQNQISKPTSDLLEAILTIFSVIGTIWILFKGISNSLLPGSSDAALNFQKNIRDPMEIVKKHFRKIILYTTKNVAIFIDDIDRCNQDNAVELLEGIQTLFKSTKVLYVISGDANWIRQCFELHYKDFQNIMTKPGYTLGDFFQEKIFQMNVNVPIIPESTVKQFWKRLVTNEKEIQNDTKENNSKLNEVRKEFKSTTTEKEINALIESRKGQQDEILYRTAAVEQLSNENVIKNIKHRLESYTSYLPPNPRALKRLVNNYALARQSLILQDISLTEVGTDSLVRWLLLVSKFPQFANCIINDPIKLSDPDFIKVKEYSDIISDKLNVNDVFAIIGK